MTHKRRWYWLDIIFLTVLSCYIMTGYKGIALFGDESMLIRQSSDFYPLIRGEWQTFALPLSTQYETPLDSLTKVRLIDGQLPPFVWGAVFYAGAYPYESLLSYDWLWNADAQANEQAGFIPPPAMLFSGRTMSVLAQVVSAWLMFVVAKRFGGRPVAYGLTLLYVLNPVLLYQTRRIKQEAFVLAFSLGLFHLTYTMARRWMQGVVMSKKIWGLFVVLGGALNASKHNAFPVLAACLLWLAWAWLANKGYSLSMLWAGAWRLIGAGVGCLLVFWALSPGYWADPIGRSLNMLELRSNIMKAMTEGYSDRLETLDARLQATLSIPLLSYPFMDGGSATPALHQRYLESPGSGIALLTKDQTLLLLVISILQVIGYIVFPSIRQAVFTRAQIVWLTGLVLISMASATLLMFNALPWPRYYLPLTPFYLLLIGVGVWGSFRMLWLAYQANFARIHHLPPAAPSTLG